jgi:hypothetical protein
LDIGLRPGDGYLLVNLEDETVPVVRQSGVGVSLTALATFLIGLLVGRKRGR